MHVYSFIAYQCASLPSPLLPCTPRGGGSHYRDSVFYSVQLFLAPCLKAYPCSAWQASDYFTPYDEQSLENSDGDLGSGGVVLFSPEGSGKQLIAQAGEQL
jgi:hypothetical protein